MASGDTVHKRAPCIFTSKTFCPIPTPNASRRFSVNTEPGMKRKLDDDNVPKEVQIRNAQKPVSTFGGMGLDPRLLQGITSEKFAAPTPIQSLAIPLALEGKDILGEKSRKSLCMNSNKSSTSKDGIGKDCRLSSSNSAGNSSPENRRPLVQAVIMSNLGADQRISWSNHERYRISLCFLQRFDSV